MLEEKLEEKLAPVLVRIAEAKTVQARHRSVRAWFTEHPENLAKDFLDLTYVLTLPGEQRTLLTYPVVGNYVLGELEKFAASTPIQRKLQGMARHLVWEKRFYNHHWQRDEIETKAIGEISDRMIGTMLRHKEEALSLHLHLCQIAGAYDVYQRTDALRWRYTNFETDPGHGLDAPLEHLSARITLPFEFSMHGNDAGPTDLSIMLVDDTEGAYWWKRLELVGFRQRPGVTHVYKDAKSALRALKQHAFDIILSDLDLGEGKMGGIEFLQQAHDLTMQQERSPALLAFSSNDELRGRAEQELYHVRPSIIATNPLHKSRFTGWDARFYGTNHTLQTR